MFQFVSDDQFVRGIWEAVRLYSQRVPVFYYQFSYEGILSGETNRTYPGIHLLFPLIFVFLHGHTAKFYAIAFFIIHILFNYIVLETLSLLFQQNKDYPLLDMIITTQNVYILLKYNPDHKMQ